MSDDDIDIETALGTIADIRKLVAEHMKIVPEFPMRLGPKSNAIVMIVNHGNAAQQVFYDMFLKKSGMQPVFSHTERNKTVALFPAQQETVEYMVSSGIINSGRAERDFKIPRVKDADRWHINDSSKGAYEI